MTRFGLSPPSGVAYAVLLTLALGAVLAALLASVHPVLGYGAAALVLFVVAVAIIVWRSIQGAVGL